ncbi:MAG: acetate--CoA ligase family protein, partial [Herbaspirillum sp.]
MPSLNSFMYPKSIAIIGASKDTAKRGFRAIQTLLDDQFVGDIYPVNPREHEILGLPCYPSLSEIPGNVDLVVICTPARTLPALMVSCGEKCVKGAVVLAGGFAESGEAGKRLQSEMVIAAQNVGVRIVGPNTSGIFNTFANCNIVGYSNLKRGGIALLSQSGNMALSLVTEGEANGNVGFSSYIGLGNEADIQFDECVDYCGEDQNTQVVIAYVEGLSHGRAFLDAVSRTSSRKPVVVYKSGRTRAGQKSAKSHTGALAGAYAVSDGALRQAGAVLVQNSDHILPVAEALSLLPPLYSSRVAILADGGGHATIAADILSELGLTLAKLSDSTREKIASMLPASASVSNPIDVAGGTDSNPAIFGECVQILLEDQQVDALFIVGLYGGYGIRFSKSLTPIELETSKHIVELYSKYKKPILVYSLYAGLRPEPLIFMRSAGIPVYASLETAARCLLALIEYGKVKQRSLQVGRKPVLNRLPSFDSLLITCRTQHRTVVLEHESRKILNDAHVPMAPTKLVHNSNEAEEAFKIFGSNPVVLKIVSKEIIHKSEVGGVILNLQDAESVRTAFHQIIKNSNTAVPKADIAGVLISPMVTKNGVEVIIGVITDQQYGPMMMFGLGGVLVEVLKDVVFRTLPITEEDAYEMIASLRAKEI